MPKYLCLQRSLPGGESSEGKPSPAQMQGMYEMNALSRLDAGARMTALRRERRAALVQTVDSADALYRAGKATYFEVLLAQQGTLSAELELNDALKEQHLAAVSLYRALGGGWR